MLEKKYSVCMVCAVCSLHGLRFGVTSKQILVKQASFAWYTVEIGEIKGPAEM